MKWVKKQAKRFKRYTACASFWVAIEPYYLSGNQKKSGALDYQKIRHIGSMGIVVKGAFKARGFGLVSVYRYSLCLLSGTWYLN